MAAWFAGGGVQLVVAVRRIFGAISIALAWAVVSEPAQAKCRMKNPDTSISDIVLTDSESAIKVVGAGAHLQDSEEDLPHARFVSTNGSQELVLFQHYGAVDDEYQEAEVRGSGAEALALKDLPIEAFRSQHGIELGMTVEQVQAIFGTCTKTRQKTGSELFIEYEITNAEHDPELKSFGYPVYYAEYEFSKGKLIRFRFGFAYP